MNELTTIHPTGLQTSNFCRDCGFSLWPDDNFCGQCGAGCRDLIVPTPAGNHYDVPSQEIATTAPAGTLQSFVDNRMFVVGAIVCVGPLGLLALWCSQSFTGQTKLMITVAYILLVVVAPVAVTCYCLSTAFEPVVEAMSKL